MKPQKAYEHGREAATNGPNTVNSNYAIFSLPELQRAWQRGYDEVNDKKEIKHTK